MATAVAASADLNKGIILRPDWLLTDANTKPEAGSAIRIVGEIVDAVGPGDSLAANYPNDEVIDLPDRIVLP